MTDNPRDFHIGDTLSVTTGILLSPRGMSGLYDLLGYMTGDEPFTHQLPRFADECAPALRAQFPDLAAVVAPKGDMEDPEAWMTWLDAQVAAHGETRPVVPLADGAHQRREPLGELASMMARSVIIVGGKR